MDYKKHLISSDALVKEVLSRLNTLAADAILFVVDGDNRLMGSLTDGDIRRGFIKGYTLQTPIVSFLQPNPKYIKRSNYTVAELEDYRQRNLKIIPIVDEQNIIIDILNLRIKTSMLPVDAVIMAGGRGERLLPLTENCPKPLLKVGDKPIIEHNVDRLIKYGIDKITISIRYLGEQIKTFFGDGSSKEVRIEYVEENEPLGTFGALSLIPEFSSEHVLLMNSDLLTNIDFTDFYLSYISSEADMMIASIPYQVKIPYAVLQIEKGDVISFDEKPTYSYYSNGGIYLFKRSLLSYLKKGDFFNATDFMELLITQKKKVAHYPILGYWLDIGKPQDYAKAQEDIKHINL
ncbi:NTP transferase domain-containing protein [Chitinophaga ginsengisegetis]|uniref:nucleotidyltransferase family protein n=1 Tax=Chitinophaga ginsengisegetis TaxID=393003 RepID=UPI00343F5204